MKKPFISCTWKFSRDKTFTKLCKISFSLFLIHERLGIVLLRPFEKLLLGFILQQNGSVARQKKKEKLANFRNVYLSKI